LKPTEKQFWMTSPRYVFIDKMLIIQPNTALRSSRKIFYYTILLFSSAQISDRQWDVGYTKEYIFCVYLKKCNIS